jgi:hypothetical protein
MIKIIKKIMSETGHEVYQTNGGIEYYSFKDKAYFFFLSLELSEIMNIKSYTDFELNKKYVLLKEDFNKLLKEGLSNTLEKNSALIILVKCITLTSIEKFQQPILLLEEDEYFFKKYVVLYSDMAIQGLNTANSLIPLLQEKVKNETYYNSFASAGYNDEIAEYLVVLQLFIKLPFLKLSFDGENYKMLSQKISEALGTDLVKTYNNLLMYSKKIEELDFSKEINEDSIDELLRSLANDKDK